MSTYGILGYWPAKVLLQRLEKQVALQAKYPKKSKNGEIVPRTEQTGGAHIVLRYENNSHGPMLSRISSVTDSILSSREKRRLDGLHSSNCALRWQLLSDAGL